MLKRQGQRCLLIEATELDKNATWVWKANGNLTGVKIEGKCKTASTAVLWSPKHLYSVVLETNGEYEGHMYQIKSRSSLEELKAEFPELFKSEGIVLTIN